MFIKISKILLKHIGIEISRNYDPKSEFKKLQYIFLPTLQSHPKTFEKYRGIHKGRNIVIVGSGPSMEHYIPKHSAPPHSDIHIGVNHTFLKHIALDYLFIQDYLGDEIMPLANKYRGSECKKFYGTHYLVKGISVRDFDEANAERYYFIANSDMENYKYNIALADITLRPLNAWDSVIFCALEFALWTYPQKIYLVGCDCAPTGHIFHSNQNGFCPNSDIKFYGWQIFKEFRDNLYPSVEIVSINPARLKGLFKDIYTQSYINANPALSKENIEIFG